MSISNEQDGKKWINTAVAILSIVVSYLIWNFFFKLGEWFDLESKIGSSFNIIIQVVSGFIGIGLFVYLITNQKTSLFLKDVFNELTKVVWPDRDQTSRHTLGIIIAVSICGFIFSLFDFSASKILSLLH